MTDAKRTVDVRKEKRTEGEDAPVVSYAGSIILDTPGEGEVVTLADVQALLEDAATENNIPATAKVTQGATLTLSWTDADLEP